MHDNHEAGGNEAVEFFQRSGLSKEPLYQVRRPDNAFASACRFCALHENLQSISMCLNSVLQIWSVVANNNPYLSKQQFYTAMRLVSAAQVEP